MRHLKTFLAAGAATITMATAIATPAFAQETTSTVSGTVTSNGVPVPGATVNIVHVPSGTVSQVTSREDGSFNLSSLRVGGPFSVEVSAPGYMNVTITDIFTSIGQTYALPVEISSEGEVIVVTASSVRGAGSVSQGPATVLNTDQIASIASVNRDIRDLSRRDPFARLDDSPSGGRSISFAGQNPRYNRFAVDGVPISDSFGLNSDGLPSRRSPIPLDAIGQFQAKVAPFDVRDGNFQGGSINIVLRSGTNDFQGTGFFAYSDESLTGKKTKPGPGVPTGRVTIPAYTYKNYGVQLSGPIIKDKLFFMIAGERVRAPLPIAEGPSDNNGGIAISTLTQAQVDNVAAIAQSRYGYDAGGRLTDNGDKDDRVVAKLDANLSDTQRVSLTYTYANDAINLLQNTAPTGAQGFGLASNAYVLGNTLHTGVVQWNSDWTDDFSTEVRGFYKNYVRIQDPVLGRGFAQFQVCTAPTSDRVATTPGSALATSCPTTFATVSFGPDSFRQTNAFNTETWGGLVQARLNRNGHDVRVFADIQRTNAFNAFLANSAGNYYFDSIADFQAGNAQRFRYGNSVPTLDPNDGAASYVYWAYTFGVQDTWRISDQLTFSYGARYDTYGSNSTPVVNPVFVNRYGYANTKAFNGLGIIQPRFGFDFKASSRLSIRGGFGLFSGGTPDVYVANSFANTGVLTNAIDISQNNNGTYNNASGAAILTNVDGSKIPSAADAVLTNATVSANSPTNAMDPNFKIPSQWRATLSATYKADLGPLGDGWEFGADVFYSTVKDQVFFTDLRVVPTGLLTPDGRTRYRPLSATGVTPTGFSSSDTNSDILLTNSKLGRSYVGVLRARKSWDAGIEAGFSFTYQDIKDQNPATSSQATSNYAAGVALDPNGPAYGISNDEVKYAFKYDLKFQRAFFGDYKTTLALFGETRIGHPYSYTFRDTATRSTVFGTVGSGTRYLMYVPTGINDPLVSYDTAANATAIDAFITASGLGKYRGKIAPRNAFNAPWFTRVDLHFSQEVPTFVGDSRVTLFADIENFTNLLNKKWGQVREYAFPYVASPVQVTCLTAPVATGTAPGTSAASNGAPCVQYRYVPNETTAGAFRAPTDTVYTRQSLYSIRVGVRFSF